MDSFDLHVTDLIGNEICGKTACFLSIQMQMYADQSSLRRCLWMLQQCSSRPFHMDCRARFTANSEQCANSTRLLVCAPVFRVSHQQYSAHNTLLLVPVLVWHPYYVDIIVGVRRFDCSCICTTRSSPYYYRCCPPPQTDSIVGQGAWYIQSDHVVWYCRGRRWYPIHCAWVSSCWPFVQALEESMQSAWCQGNKKCKEGRHDWSDQQNPP